MSEGKKEKKKKINYAGVFLWWKVDKEELNKQVHEYKSLKIYQSARGISLLAILFSNVVTVLFVFFAGLNVYGLIDALILLILGIFIFKGNKWAMIGAMLFWTLEKIIAVTEQPNTILSTYFWWTAYMYAFYLAFQVERARIKANPSKV